MGHSITLNVEADLLGGGPSHSHGVFGPAGRWHHEAAVYLDTQDRVWTGSVPFGSERDSNGMLGQERPGPQAWLGGRWDYVLLPAFRPPDFAPPGEGHFPGAIDINLDLDSLKARKSLYVT